MDVCAANVGFLAEAGPTLVRADLESSLLRVELQLHQVLQVEPRGGSLGARSVRYRTCSVLRDVVLWCLCHGRYATVWDMSCVRYWRGGLCCCTVVGGIFVRVFAYREWHSFTNAIKELSKKGAVHQCDKRVVKKSAVHQCDKGVVKKGCRSLM